MKYKIIDLKLQVDISGKHLYKDALYDSFRNDVDMEYDVKVECDFSDDISLIDLEVIYEEKNRLTVFKDNEKEHRFFYNGVTMEPVAHLIKNGNRKHLIIKNENIHEMLLFNYMGLEQELSERGYFILHSSFIETEKGAILFTAPSETGKSTQAELWKKYKGAVIVNGDRSCIWKESGVWYAGGIPWAGTSGIQLNRKMPIVAIVILEQGQINTVTTPRLMTKMKTLMEQITINPWDKDMRLRTQNMCVDLCGDVPIYTLSCRPDKGAVDILAEKIGV